MESLIQKYPALSISDFKITDDVIKKFNERDIESDSLKFIKIILEESGESERHNFWDLNSMLQHEDLIQKSYMFFEYTSSEKTTSIYYVQKDLDRNISFKAYIDPLPFKRTIYLNSKNDIAAKDQKTSNHSRINLKLFSNLEYYIGLAALIHIFTNTTSEDFDILTQEAKEFGRKIFIKGTQIHVAIKENNNSPNNVKMDSSLKMGYRERAIYIRGLVESLTFRKTINKDHVEKLLVNIDKLIEEFDNENKI